MWARDDSSKSRRPNEAPSGAAPVRPPLLPIGAVAAAGGAPAVAVIGPSVVIQGELSGAEDLVIEGRVEGQISFPGHLVRIGRSGTISGDLVAKAVVVEGLITGNVRASERVELKTDARMTGDVVSPTIVMLEGATFQGQLDVAGHSARLHAFR
jgi:cytoskeletal protein CcmA (bactofilin family)